MRAQLEQTPQKSGRPSDSVGLRQFTAWASISGERVFSRSAGAGQDERVGKTARAHALAQVRDGGRVAEEVLKAHGLRVTGNKGPRNERTENKEQGADHRDRV